MSVATRGNPSGVTVTFSAPVSANTATAPANYAITPGVTVNSVTLLTANQVRLHTTAITEGQPYQLAIQNVTDRSSHPNPIAADTQRSFLQTQGGITRREFHNIGGSLLSDLTNHAKFTGDQPDVMTFTTALETPVDARDSYGVQFLGYITAPVTGDYTFYLSSDDQGALFLSTDDQPANRQRIAEEPQWNGSRQFIVGSNQASRIQPSEAFFAGALFIEAEDFDFGGGQFVTDASTGMSGAYTGGAYAGKGTTADSDIDWHEELPANANAQHRTSAGVEMQTAGGFLNGSRGTFTVTQNFTVGWNDAGDWMNYTRVFPAPARDYHVFAAVASGGADIAAKLDEVTAGVGTTTQTLAELGKFNAPATGNWSGFTLVPLRNAANEVARVNLGGQRTLRFTTLPGNNDFDYLMFLPAGIGEPDLSTLRPVNITAPVHLEAGHRYYLEALMKEGGGGDNLAVTWRIPGGPEVANGSEPIPGEFLSGVEPLVPASIVSQPHGQTVNEHSAVTFTVSLAGTPPYDFQWYRNGEMLVGETGPTLTLPTVAATLSGSRFHVVCGNGLNSLRSADATLTVVPDLTPPQLVFAEGRASLDEVGVGFSEPIDAADAVDLGRYQLSGGLTILGATLWGNQRLVILKTSPQTPGQSYTVTVNGLHDRATSRNVIAPGSQLAFTGFDAGLPVSALPPGYQRITVTTRTGPVTVVLPRREFHFEPAGQTYYLATTGIDANLGSLTQPWRTFAHALNQLQPGDLLYVRAGEYPEPFVVSRSGVLGKPIILSAFPGERVRIFPPAGWEPAPGTTHGANTIQIDGSHIWIHGFEIQGPPRELGYRPLGTPILSAIQLGGGGEGCRILNNLCYQAQYSGIKDQTGSFDYLVEGNLCFDNGTPIDETYPAGSGLYLPGPARTGTIVRGNASFNNGRSGFSHFHRPANHHVYNNVIFHNGLEAGSFGLVTSGHHNLYAHNVLLDNIGGGLTLYGAGSEGLPNDNRVLNSIVVNNSSYQLGKTDEPPLGNWVDFCQAHPFENWANQPAWLEPFTGSSMLFEPPRFVNAAGNDFRNLEGAATRGAAKPVILLGARSQPDIGLFPATEYWEPALVAIPAQSVDEGTELRFAVQLAEPALPDVRIGYRLADYPPRGAAIDAVTGEFRWTPNEHQGPGVYRITVVAMADNSPVVYGARTFNVTVNDANRPPVLGLATPTTGSDFTGTTDLARNGAAWTTGSLESLSTGAFRVTAYGGGQDNFSDLGHFAWREVYGDFDARVRVSSLTAAGSFTRAGLMLRESLEPDARMSFAFVFPAGLADDGFPGKNGYAFDRRSGTGTQTLPQMEISPEAPFPNAWLRLRRIGNVLSYFRSNDGQTWTQLLSQETGLPPAVYLGLGTQAARYETDVFTVAEYHDFEIRHTTPQAPGNLPGEEGLPLVLSFLAHDFDRPAQSLSYSLVTPPAGATIDPGTGLFTWTPPESAGGQSFPITVRVTDDGEQPRFTEQTFNVTVGEVNLPPVLPEIANQSAAEGQPFSLTVAAADPDLPANALTYALGAGAPAGLTFGAASGVLAWTPDEIQGGQSFPVTVRVTDDGVPPLSAERTFTITVVEVNAAPLLAAIGAKAVNEGSALNFTVSADDPNDTPANAVTLSVTGLPAGATFNPVTGVFVWTPGEAQQGEHQATFTATDAGTPPLAVSETITITVGEVNAAPVLANIGAKTVDEGSALNFTVSAGDPNDTPANTVTLSATGLPAGASFNPATGAFAWTPGETQQGTHQLTFTATDNGVPPLSASETVTLTVNEVNTAPFFTEVIPPQVVAEGATLTLTNRVADADQPADTLRFSLAADAPAGAAVEAVTGVFTWTPTEVQGPGTHALRVIVTDDGVPPRSATNEFTVTVTEVNVAPVLAAAGARAVNEGAALNFTVSAGDPNDTPANAVALSVTGLPTGASFDPATGDFAWTPGETQQGVHVVTFTATDNGVPPRAASETVTITVAEVNTAPVLATIGTRAVNEGNALTFTVSAGDPNDTPANAVALSVAGLPTGASFNPTTGAFDWTPSEAQQGSHQVTFTATDNGVPPLAVSETVTITVHELNAAPVLAAIGAKSVDEGTTLNFTVSAADPNDTPANAVTLSATGLPPGASFNPTTGAFDWTPSEAQQGSHQVTFTATDNGVPPLSVGETVTITVGEVNAAPVISSIGAKSVDEDAVLNFTVSAGDPNDMPANAITLSATGLPTGATFNPTTGAFAWTPGEAQQGDHRVTFTATDNGVPPLAVSETVTITVAEVNAAPVLAELDDRVIDELKLLSFTIAATDPDLPASGLIYSFGPGAPSGVALDPKTGVFAWTPAEAQGPGAYPVTVRVTDNGTPPRSAERTFTVTVREVNLAPTVHDDTATTPEDSLLELPAANLLANDTDPDGNVLTLSAVAPASTRGGQVTLTTGIIRYTPPADFHGTDTFNYTADDGAGLTATAVVTVTVVSVNDPPVAVAVHLATDEDTPLPLTLAGVDAEGSPLTFQILQGPAHGTLLGIPPVLTYLPAADFNGPDTFTFRVNDGQLDSPSATVTLEVRSLNDPPILAMTHPAATDAYFAPATVPLAVAASDPDGAVVLVEFFHGAEKVGERLAPPYLIDVSGLVAGEHAFYARATDNLGATTLTPTVHVQVLVAIHGVTLTPAGSVHLELVGEPGQTYEVEASSDLAGWLGLGPLTAGPDGRMTFAEPRPAGAEARFYRVVRR